MKEAVGESAMTIITIVLVAGAVGAIVAIIGNLLGNQQKRARCENEGFSYTNGACINAGGQTCVWNSDAESYNCGG